MAQALGTLVTGEGTWEDLAPAIRALPVLCVHGAYLPLSALTVVQGPVAPDLGLDLANVVRAQGALLLEAHDDHLRTW